MFFGYGAVADGVAGGVDRFGVTGDQGMPFRKIFSFGHTPVGAALGEPPQVWNVPGLEPEAVGNQYVAQIVVTAAARLSIQQETGD